MGEDITVIPLTSAQFEKQSDKFDVIVNKDEQNHLYQNSYARVRQIRAVSGKRLGKVVGTITDPEVRRNIDAAIVEMLGIEV